MYFSLRTDDSSPLQNSRPPTVRPSAGVLISIYVLIPQGIHVLATLGRRNLPIFLGPYH
jgi:hypothetical protein